MSIAPMPRPDLIDPITGMPRTGGFGLGLPFTRTPQERAVEGLERKRKQEEAIKEKAGQLIGAVRGSGLTKFAGGVGGGIAGSKAGAAAGTAIAGPVGGVVGGVAGSLIGGAVGEKAGEAVGGMREKKMAGELMRTAFGGGAITGDSADRRSPTEEMVMGNPMASPFAADSVRMPQDLQAGYMHMNRFGSPLPIHGLGTPGRTTMAQDIQDGNLVMQHRMQVANRDPISMSRLNMIGGMGDFS
tara:strand:- start:78 stop:806 length:729 start_codon:yes stop_codon:yes gene_type:complete